MNRDAKDQKPQNEMDTTGELWDSIAEDLLTQGAPCQETIEKLVDKACRQPQAGKKK
ncbi:hypothetical protein [Dethiosulfatarculus sandiegensis]|uniref:Uncharacterized protein n=1 Tax=Dethiosulfatarculus sandiegensis TaxID=1429043 RepID=A0A0D2K1Y6_9BACT|nr:hypothetical protein [Dethiosulfatarculus sandiegensis]KIX15690.1 hypothetical protein X474_02285 [Dethiosulfatarculus sandiegensis]